MTTEETPNDRTGEVKTEMSRPRVPRVALACANPECANRVHKREADIIRSRTKRFFCSPTCRDTTGTRIRSKGTHKCEHCGDEFYERSQGPNRYCSTACFGAAHRVRSTVTLACENCGTEFTRQASADGTSTSRYCTRKCYHEKRHARAEARRAVYADDVLADRVTVLIRESSPALAS